MLLACVAILSLGRYIERTLGVFIWILVALRGRVRAAFANGAVETFARYTIVC